MEGLISPPEQLRLVLLKKIEGDGKTLAIACYIDVGISINKFMRFNCPTIFNSTPGSDPLVHDFPDTKKQGTGIFRNSFFLFILLLLSFSAKANVRVEFCFEGVAQAKEVNKIRTIIQAHPDNVWCRITPTGKYFSGEFVEGTTLSRNDFAAWIAPLGLSLNCFFQSSEHAEPQMAMREYVACRTAHVASLKTTTSGSCAAPTTICDGTNLAVTPWGPGFTILPSPDGFRNPAYDPFFSLPPWTNTWGTNYGCLQAGELNTTWLRITITGAGNLEWAFTFPDFDGFNTIFMDWSMWTLNASTCANLAANNAASAPLRCNWNDLPASPLAATGMVRLAGSIPIAGEQDNFERFVPVSVGNQFLLLLDNYSAGTFNGSFDFSLSGTSATVCTAVLSAGHTELVAEAQENAVQLGWFNLGDQPYSDIAIERSSDGTDWQQLAPISNEDFMTRPSYVDRSPLSGKSLYRMRKLGSDGVQYYSNVVEVDFAFAGGFSISPVPANGQSFSIHTAQTGGDLRIMDLAGKVRYAETLKPEVGKSTWEIHPDLHPGVYLIEIRTASGVHHTRKVVVH